MNLKPLTGASKMSSMRNISCYCFRSPVTALQLETNVDEIVRGPWTRVPKRQFVFVFRSNLFNLLIEFRLSIAFDEKGGVHYHSIADGFIRTRCDRGVAQLRIHLANVRISLIGQSSFNQSAQ